MTICVMSIIEAHRWINQKKVSLRCYVNLKSHTLVLIFSYAPVMLFDICAHNKFSQL